MIRILGAPFDKCGRMAGSRLGPGALRIADLEGALQSIRVAVRDDGDIPLPQSTEKGSGIPHFKEGVEVARRLRKRVADTIVSGDVPLVLGGDHSISIGSVSGAIQCFGRKLAVLWIDAHADYNTPATSPSLNLHGMSLAALVGFEVQEGRGAAELALDALVGFQVQEGRGADDWAELLESVVPAERLAPSHTAWYGLRDVDMGERAHIQASKGCLPLTMHDVDRYGVSETVAKFNRWMRESGAEALWVSFDVDVMDPVLAPGTGTAVRGGLSYREAHLLAELLHESLAAPGCPYRLVGLDVVETNPTRDRSNETATTAVEWVASLFGKTILGER
ncbi:MAG: arginase [Fimbriimonadaceae bacterium]|nr:arginase [Fimbriimonadaceae bacterium]